MAARQRVLARSLVPLFAAILAACGGGGGDGNAPPAPPAASIQGTAAVGAALAQAQVEVTDSSRTSVCTEASIVTSGTGDFTCTLQAGKSAPFLVVVTDPSGARPPMVSVATSTPAAGTPLVVNATPLTTAIVGQLASGGNALAVVADRSLLDLSALASIKAKVLTQIAPALTALGAPPGYDPFSTQIVAATSNQAGNTADQVIDTLRFSTVNGVTEVSTVDNPGGAVPLAGAAATTPPQLPAPSASVTSLASSLRLLATALNQCFALPVATRVVAANTSIPASQGGPEVTESAPECDGIVIDGFLNNGYKGGQFFYGVLTDAAMVGAKWAVPEVMRFIEDTTAADADRAVLNMRYVDANGVAGNLISVAQKFPGTSTTARPSDWWLYGNQQAVDSSIRPFIRLNNQLAPNPGTAPFVNASASRYESGLNIFINKDGPNSAGMRAARVTGPGLPPAGLVYTRPDPAICTEQTWLNVRRKDGLTDAASATFAADVGNIFRLQRTDGVSGTSASTVRPNPNAGNANTTAFPAWAHPLDYGAAVGATNYIDFSALRANIIYTFEIYYDGETAPRYTLSKTLLAPVVPAARGGDLQWISLTDAALAHLNPADPLGAAQTSMNLSWSANRFAETIQSAGVYTFDAAGTVNQGLVGVARGATSAVATAPGATGACDAGTSFKALTNDGNSGRAIQLRYRMLDGGYKDSMTRYN